MDKLVIEGIPEFKAEDGAAAYIMQVDNGLDSGIYARIISWDEENPDFNSEYDALKLNPNYVSKSEFHKQLQMFKGKKVKITVEEI
jgi:hypothetical protein